MDCKINKETKTLDFIEGGTTVLVLSFEEAARRGVPFSRDEKDYNTIILDISPQPGGWRTRSRSRRPPFDAYLQARSVGVARRRRPVAAQGRDAQRLDLTAQDQVAMLSPCGGRA